MKNKSCAWYIVKYCVMAFVITPVNANAAVINFTGQLDLIDVDDGGVYSGVTTSTNFTGNIDDVTANGSISDGTTVTPFGCCIAAGGFSITNNEMLNAEEAALLNSITGTPTFSAGDIIDIVDIEGDATTAGGGRIEVGLNYILDGNAFANTDPGNYPFNPNELILTLFFIVEEDVSGVTIFDAVGQANTVPAPVDLSGTVKTADGTDICAMVLASGQFMFSCNPVGVFSLTDLPLESNGTVKRQSYADGFFPKIDTLTGSSDDTVVMTRSGTCPSYNAPYDPAVVPGSAGKRIDIAGKVLAQNSQTPICAMVLANGQHMFSCDGTGSYGLNIPLDANGQFKLQVYADGFAPTIQSFDEFMTTNDVRMARATECQ